MGDNADDFPNNAGVQTFRVADSSFSVNILPQDGPQVQDNVLATIEPPPVSGTTSDSVEFYLGQPPSCAECLSISGDTGQFTYDWSDDTSHQDQFSIVVQYQGEVLEANIDVAFNTDPLYKHQWHLENSGQDNFTNYPGSTGEDLRVAGPITNGYTGEGVLVAIVDDGLELAHEDLAGNIVSGSRDFVEDDDDPTNPLSDSGHGTAVAGIVAAEGWNNIGVRGAAPSASLVGYNFLEFQTTASLYASFGQETYSSGVDIFNASLGAVQSALMSEGWYGGSTTDGILFGEEVLSLRDGKGAIIVKSSGNSFDIDATERCGNESGTRVSCVDANTDYWHQYPSVIVTAALRADGLKSSYSSPGSVVWISGFGGEYGFDSSVYNISEFMKGPAVMSTDKATCNAGYSNDASPQSRNAFEPGWLSDSGYRHPDNPDCNYLSTMNGTSSAAPSVSGAIALVLEANPDLSYREVKHIIAATARQVDPTFAPVIIDGISYHEWRTNSAGYHHHNWYGFGAIDAESAVSYAENWDTSVYPFNAQEISSWTDNQQTPMIVVDNDGSEQFSATTAISSATSGVVEYVTVKVDVDTAIPNGYGLRLVSPSGTVSSLLHPHTAISTLYDGSAILSSAAFYGETIAGDWTIEVYDHLNDGNSVALNSWALQFHHRQP